MKSNRRPMYQWLLAAVIACSLPTPALAADDNHDIVVLSNRADLISGGDALVELIVPPGIIQALRSGGNVKIQASLNGVPVPKDTFALRPDGRIYGVVKGLRVGANQLTAQVPGKSMSIVITNHPHRRTGVAAARKSSRGSARRPRPSPESGNTPASNASGLTTVAFDSQCNIATEYKLFYRTTTAGCSTCAARPESAGRHRRRTTASSRTRSGSAPADLATTTTTTGLTVPYIVRVERGTMNRGIYDIAVLFDPTQTQPWTPLAPQAQWNGKVVYTFGASTGQPRLQFRTEQNWADRLRAVARLHGRRQQPHRFALQLQSDPGRRDLDDDEGAHRRHATAKSSTRWATAAPAARSSRTRPPRPSPACSTASSRAATFPTRSRLAWRSPIACCW